MALDEIQQKKEVVEGRARIREFVFGIQDGLISTVGLLAGVQGATENNAVVMITGLTAMCAGAVSMAAGSYLSSSAEKEIFAKELRDAEELAEREPYLAAEGLLNALSQEGLKKEQSYRIVKLLAQEEGVFLRTFQEKVFGNGGDQPPGSSRAGDGRFFCSWSFDSSSTLLSLNGGEGALRFYSSCGRDVVFRRCLQGLFSGEVSFLFRTGVFFHRRWGCWSWIFDWPGRPIFFSGDCYSGRIVKPPVFSLSFFPTSLSPNGPAPRSAKVGGLGKIPVEETWGSFFLFVATLVLVGDTCRIVRTALSHLRSSAW